MKPEVKAFYDPRTNTLSYVVWDPATRDAVVIDPVLDYSPVGSFTWTESVDAITRFVREHELSLRFSLETHAHADHLSGSPLIRRRFGVPIVIGEKIREVQHTFRAVFDLGPEFAEDGSQFDRLVKDGEILSAGSLEISVIATPGHTPACVTYRIGDALFTGDVLFMDDYGTGRCDFPNGSAAAMYDSVRKLYELPDETRVFVGHDYQPGDRELRWQTTIGASKQNNPQLAEKTTREEFIRFRNERDRTLAAPALLYQSVQVNIDAGRLPAARANGIRYLALPVNHLRPADELGEPLAKK